MSAVFLFDYNTGTGRFRVHIFTVATRCSADRFRRKKLGAVVGVRKSVGVTSLSFLPAAAREAWAGLRMPVRRSYISRPGRGQRTMRAVHKIHSSGNGQRVAWGRRKARGRDGA